MRILMTGAGMDEADFARARAAMVETQLRRREIHDPAVLEAFRAVPRHLFVGEKQRGAAYGDHPLPIGEGQTISQPYMVALMTQCLEIRKGARILEVGTGCGYQAAILSRIAPEVFTIERIPSLSRKAEEILDGLGYTNVRFFVGDGTRGLPGFAPYDGIVVTAGAPRVPQPLVDQLAEGGRLVIPVGGRWSQELIVLHKGRGGVAQRGVCGCVFVPLLGDHGW